jgi:hypothetical protein
MTIVTGQNAEAGDFINESERSVDPTDDEGKVPKLEADGKLSNEFTKSVIRIQYDLADSPATWVKKDGLKYIQVEAWGGGGNGGSRDESSARVSGGGGGGYTKKIIEAGDLGETETVTVGGAATNSTFGSLVTGYRGGNGTASGSETVSGGGGGGQLGAGSNGSTSIAAAGGSPGFPSSGYGVKLADGVLPELPIRHGTFGGGGGSNGSNNGGNSVYGGGGGGGGANGSLGGESVYGGNGGNGAAGSAAQNGQVPGGGGGGCDLVGGVGSAGAGGAGRVIVTEFY